MKLYRVYTEDKGIPKLREEIEQIVSKRFDGYTIFDGAVGYWKGARENSLVVEIMADGEHRNWIDKVARQIKAVNKQQAVLITETAIDATFV